MVDDLNVGGEYTEILAVHQGFYDDVREQENESYDTDEIYWRENRELEFIYWLIEADLDLPPGFIDDKLNPEAVSYVLDKLNEDYIAEEELIDPIRKGVISEKFIAKTVQAINNNQVMRVYTVEFETHLIKAATEVIIEKIATRTESGVD